MRKNRIIKLGLIGAILVLGVNGCQKIPVQVKPMLTTTQDKVVQFGTDKVTGEQVSNINMLDFSSKIKNLTHLEKYHRYDKCPIEKVRGVKVTKKLEGYLVEYLNGEYYCNLGDTDATKMSYLFKTKYQDSKIIFSYPKSYKYSVEDSLFGKYEQFATPSEVERDIQNIYNNLHKITINKTHNFSEEMNTQYPDKSIYANFKRLLGQYNYRSREQISELKKRNTFSLKFKGKSYPLYVEVVPYRDGSKVIYSTKLYYGVGTGGKCSLSKNEIEQLHNRVKKIVEN